MVTAGEQQIQRLYPSVTLWPLTRTERRAIIERINPSIPNFGTY
jgi:hypothetical protein